MAKVMTEEERIECMKLYSTGSTLDQLAEHFGRHRCTIEALVRRTGSHRGHSLRKRGPRQYKYWERTLGLT